MPDPKERVFGYTAKEASGESIGMIIPPELHSEEIDIASRLALGEAVQNYETVRVGKVR